MTETVEALRARALAGIAHGFLGRTGGVSTGPTASLDMGRRGLHDEGSRILQDSIKRKIKVDFDTARRLFTLICVLHWKG